MSQSQLSRIESGELDGIPVRTLRAAFGALGARVTVTLHWNGAELDRLLDERHALLCAAVLPVMRRAGWDVLPEVTFSHFGERGSIDLLAVRQSDRVAVVVEVKTELASLEETQRRLDAKVRLAPGLVFDRLGWRPTVVSRLLVLPEGSGTRHQVARHQVLLQAAFPHGGRAVRAWLRVPSGSLSGLWILSNSGTAGHTRISPMPRRVRRAREARAILPNSSRSTS